MKKKIFFLIVICILVGLYLYSRPSEKEKFPLASDCHSRIPQDSLEEALLKKRYSLKECWHVNWYRKELIDNERKEILFSVDFETRYANQRDDFSCDFDGKKCWYSIQYSDGIFFQTDYEFVVPLNYEGEIRDVSE